MLRDRVKGGVIGDIILAIALALLPGLFVGNVFQIAGASRFRLAHPMTVDSRALAGYLHLKLAKR